MDMSFNKTHGRLASVGDGEVRVWDVDNSGTCALSVMMYARFHSHCATGILTALAERSPRKDATACSVQFLQDGASILISYIESHEM